MSSPQRRSRILVPLSDVEVRDSGAGDGSYTIRGLAAVFNRLSLDLGGFREKIDEGAFTRVLDENPHVLCDWDHDTRWTLGNTANGTLELREIPQGLHYWCRVAPTSYAADLRVLLQRGDISQASFMFTIERERWEEDAEGNITATIEEIGALYDVTVTGRGAYPQTDSTLANSLATDAHERLATALQEGRVLRTAPDHSQEDAPAGDVEPGVTTEDPEREPTAVAEEPGSEDVAPEADVIEEAPATPDTSAHSFAVAEARRRRAGA